MGRRLIKEKTILNKYHITRDACDEWKDHNNDNPYAQDYILEKHIQPTELST